MKREAQRLEQEITEYAVLKQKKRLGYHDIKAYLKSYFPEQYRELAKKASKGELADRGSNATHFAETESAVFEISYVTCMFANIYISI